MAPFRKPDVIDTLQNGSIGSREVTRTAAALANKTDLLGLRLPGDSLTPQGPALPPAAKSGTIPILDTQDGANVGTLGALTPDALATPAAPMAPDAPQALPVAPHQSQQVGVVEAGAAAKENAVTQSVEAAPPVPVVVFGGAAGPSSSAAATPAQKRVASTPNLTKPPQSNAALWVIVAFIVAAYWE